MPILIHSLGVLSKIDKLRKGKKKLLDEALNHVPQSNKKIIIMMTTMMMMMMMMMMTTLNVSSPCVI